MIAPGRAILVACVVALPLLGAAIACSGGDEIAYQAPGATSEGGAGGGEGGRIVRESGTNAVEPAEAGHIDPSNGLPCSAGLTAADPTCDWSAGVGCCVRASDTACIEGAEYYAHVKDKCDQAGSVFVSCRQGDDDNVCCWGTDAVTGTKDTHFAATCGANPASCDPGADGGSCPNGAKCRTTTCNSVTLGYCGDGPAPCP